MISRLPFALHGVFSSATHRLRQLSSAPLAPVSATAPSLGQQAVGLAKELVRSRARFIVGGAVLSSIYYIWSTESEVGVVSDMCGVFEAGGGARWDAGFFNDARATVERPVVEANLANILRPSVVDKYAVVVGPSGTGKSTSVRKVLHALIAEGEGGAGAGIIYFSMREHHTDFFSQDLAQAVGYRTPIVLFDRIRRYVTGETKEQRYEPRATWSPLSRLLKEAAILHKEKHGKAPTLVLDAMDLVAKEDPKFFSQVQDFAKACADRGIMRVVFIFSDGDGLPLLLSSSAESRCDKDQVYEVGDISDADAIKLVVSRYGKDELHAKELVETITGGRFTLLQDYGKTTKPLDAIRKVLDIETASKLRSAGVHAMHPMLMSLAASTTITKDVAEEMLELPKISQLLRLNILAMHLSGTYTINMRHVEMYIKRTVAAGRRAEEPAAKARR